MHVSHDRPHRGSTLFIGLWALALVACTRARTPVASPTSEAPRVATAGEPRGADAALDGAYQVRWHRGGAVAGVVSLEDGRYTWVGRAPDPGERTFAFVARPNGRYTTEMRAGFGGGDVLGIVDFAPGDSAIPEAERRVEVRRDPARRVRFFHSVVSELELWQIETLH